MWMLVYLLLINGEPVPVWDNGYTSQSDCEARLVVLQQQPNWITGYCKPSEK